MKIKPEMEAQYIELLIKLLIDIDDLDKQTPWHEFEPRWWLEMMEFRVLAADSLKNRLEHKRKMDEQYPVD